MSQHAVISESAVSRLARFFAGAMPVRIPVRVALVHSGTAQENTIIEFGTSMEVLFASTLPLEFGESVRLVNSDGSLDAEASVVGIQYQDGHKAIAARFSRTPSNWIIKA